MEFGEHSEVKSGFKGLPYAVVPQLKSNVKVSVIYLIPINEQILFIYLSFGNGFNNFNEMKYVEGSDRRRIGQIRIEF